MAEIQHKSITDPNIHEPKGVKFAAQGTAYVADGSGSGSWQSVVLSGAQAPISLFTVSFNKTLTTDIGNTIFPSDFVQAETVGSPELTSVSNHVLVNKSGIYQININLTVGVRLYSAAENTHSATIQITKNTSALQLPSPSVLPTTATGQGTFTGQRTTKQNTFSFACRLAINDRVGFWVTGYQGNTQTASQPSILGTMQFVRLGDA